MDYQADSKKVAEIVESIETELEKQARGSYQENLLSGGENWSGSSLKSKASNYGARYAESRGRLLKRLNDIANAHGVRFTTRLVLNENKRHQRMLVAEKL